MPRLETGRFGWDYVLHVGRDSQYIQSDWDYPATARALGWSLIRVQKRRGRVVHLARVIPYRGGARSLCYHRETDGTVDCPSCGITASAFINAAREYLDRVAR